MSHDLPDDWYIEPTGESMILDQEKVAAEIERLRTTLATVRLFIETEMIAHAVVVLEGADARDPNNPTLLKLIDAALGDDEQRGDGK